MLATLLVAEVHPFTDGNGRLARQVMNAELSVVNSCRITRDAQAAPLLAAMQKIHQWTAAFDCEDLDQVITQMQRCNAFERIRVRYKLLSPGT